MRVLFLENRYQTYFWAEIAKRLIEGGHSVHWIVQNHAFAPKSGVVHSIPYPPASALEHRDIPADLLRVSQSDRNINYFGGDVRHYPYYRQAIVEILDNVNPDVIYGETTLFHELLTLAAARERNIPYLQPTTTRYPSGRFSFYLYDTLYPFGGSGEQLTDHQADALVEGIVGRKTVPDYMLKPARESRWREYKRKAFDRMRLTQSYISGERFNTPHPMRKMHLQRELASRLADWQRLTKTRSPLRGRFTLLYPMQLQPEANLDVWGRKHRRQEQLLRAMHAATDEQTQIVVKANPKAKYEMSAELLAAITDCDRLIPLPLDSSMCSVFPTADLIATVTGTVAIEATLAAKPVVTFIRTPWNDNPGCRFMESPERIADAVCQVRNQSFPLNSIREDRRFLQDIVATSYRGLTSAPFHVPKAAEPENISLVYQAFVDVLARLQADSAPGLHMAVSGRRV
jgi:hypothetical protein